MVKKIDHDFRQKSLLLVIDSGNGSTVVSARKDDTAATVQIGYKIDSKTRQELRKRLTYSLERSKA